MLLLLLLGVGPGMLLLMKPLLQLCAVCCHVTYEWAACLLQSIVMGPAGAACTLVSPGLTHWPAGPATAAGAPALTLGTRPCRHPATALRAEDARHSG